MTAGSVLQTDLIGCVSMRLWQLLDVDFPVLSLFVHSVSLYFVFAATALDALST